MSILKGNAPEQLTAIVNGVAASGLFFCGFLYVYLDPRRRSISPDAAQGYTSLIHAKHGDVYGTYFEQLTTTYGPLLMLLILTANIAFSFRYFYIERRPKNVLPGFAAAALTMIAFIALWMTMP
jgi:hypothetical protein